MPNETFLEGLVRWTRRVCLVTILTSAIPVWTFPSPCQEHYGYRGPQIRRPDSWQNVFSPDGSAFRTPTKVDPSADKVRSSRSFMAQQSSLEDSPPPPTTSRVTDTPPSRSSSSSINGRIPPPCQFDDPVDLSVVVSWVEDIWSREWGALENIKPLFYDFGMGYTQVAVCVSESQQKIYVTFRGTDIMELPDIWSNLNILWDDFGPRSSQTTETDNATFIGIPGKVQRGWNRKVFNSKLYLPLSEKILEVKKDYPRYQVVVAGHSLGAALSILFGAYVAKYVVNDHPVENRVQVINLGSPRVGDEEFYHAIQQIHNLSIWRMVFENDIVPRYPPMCLGYRHVGHMLHWEGGNCEGNDSDNNNINEDSKRQNDAPGKVKAYHQQLESCMDSECYAGIQPSEWNILAGRIDHHEHRNYKCILDQAKKDPEIYWPSGFEMKD